MSLKTWQKKYPGAKTDLVLGKWQDVIEQVGLFDGIFFDTYPLSEEEYLKFVIEDVTFWRPFF